MSTFEDTHDRGLLNSADLKRRLTRACVWSTSLADLERLPLRNCTMRLVIAEVFFYITLELPWIVRKWFL